MNQQLFYDLMLTAALFMCGMLGMIHSVDNPGSLYLGISSSVVLIGSISYMFTMPRFLSLPERKQHRHLVGLFCEYTQKTAVFAVVAQCFIILASAVG